MKTQVVPELFDLKQARAATGGHVSTGALRAAIRRGELNAIRTTDACTARILIDAADLAAWLRGRCSGRNIVPSTREVAAANRQTDDCETA